jgi:Na+:H+ antiporter, NhaA family
MDRQSTPTPAERRAEPSLLRRILIFIESFLRVETAGGLTLLAATAIALLWANLSPHTYELSWSIRPPAHAFGIPFLEAQSLRFWINDGLMTLFFLVVGIEIRHEMRHGVLSDARIATLPIIAAIGGVLVPALIYLLINSDATTRAGWAVPTATDIAFAVGILSLLGKGLPPVLRLLLLTLAIIDDIAAIIIIATAYSHSIEFSGFAIAACGVLAIWVMQRLRVRNRPAYLLPGLLLWVGLLRAGVHPTLAGVILGMMAPATAASHRLLRTLHPWVAYAIMPLFALANAGVDVRALSFSGSGALSIKAGIILGLVLGKPLGIVLASGIAVRAKVCQLPQGLHWRHIVLLGCLGGIGFTMSIFIANLAFPDPALLATAKSAVLVASTAAALMGLAGGKAWR